MCRLVSNPMVKRDFAALLAGGEGDKRQIAALADLLERLTALDPDRCAAPVHEHRRRLGALWCLRHLKIALKSLCWGPLPQHFKWACLQACALLSHM